MTAHSATVTAPELTRRSRAEVFDQFSAMYDLIGRRAFEIFQTRGGLPGHDVEDWLQAESELLHPIRINLTESDSRYIVRAEVPGFRIDDIEIAVEPRHLMILGERKTSLQEENGQTICSEWCADRILRTVDLPSDVDTSQASTSVRDGILTVELPKAQDAN